LPDAQPPPLVTCSAALTGTDLLRVAAIDRDERRSATSAGIEAMRVISSRVAWSRRDLARPSSPIRARARPPSRIAARSDAAGRSTGT
jgi:hypothetical protein